MQNTLAGCFRWKGGNLLFPRAASRADAARAAFLSLRSRVHLASSGSATEILVSLYSSGDICSYFFNICKLDFFFTRWDNIGHEAKKAAGLTHILYYEKKEV